MVDTRRILVDYDNDARVWWAESNDLPGLASEASTLDALFDRVAAVVPELLSASGGTIDQKVCLEFLVTRQIQAV